MLSNIEFARVRAWGLIDTEQTHGPSIRFRSFLAGRRIPGYGAALGWVSGRQRLRRSGLVLGGAFVDRDLLNGEFDEFFLAPLHESAEHRRATMRLLASFDYRYFTDLPALHAKMTQPVQLVWGAHDPFFPVEWAHEMVTTFANASLDVIPDASLFAHEERPADVAASLLRVLTP